MFPLQVKRRLVRYCLGLHLLFCILRLFSDFYRSLMSLRWYASPEKNYKKTCTNINQIQPWPFETSPQKNTLKLLLYHVPCFLCQVVLQRKRFSVLQICLICIKARVGYDNEDWLFLKLTDFLVLISFGVQVESPTCADLHMWCWMKLTGCLTWALSHRWVFPRCFVRIYGLSFLLIVNIIKCDLKRFSDCYNARENKTPALF